MLLGKQCGSDNTKTFGQTPPKPAELIDSSSTCYIYDIQLDDFEMSNFIHSISEIFERHTFTSPELDRYVALNPEVCMRTMGTFDRDLFNEALFAILVIRYWTAFGAGPFLSTFERLTRCNICNWTPTANLKDLYERFLWAHAVVSCGLSVAYTIRILSPEYAQAGIFERVFLQGLIDTSYYAYVTMLISRNLLDLPMAANKQLTTLVMASVFIPYVFDRLVESSTTTPFSSTEIINTCCKEPGFFLESTTCSHLKHASKMLWTNTSILSIPGFAAVQFYVFEMTDFWLSRIFCGNLAMSVIYTIQSLGNYVFLLQHRQWARKWAFVRGEKGKEGRFFNVWRSLLAVFVCGLVPLVWGMLWRDCWYKRGREDERDQGAVLGNDEVALVPVENI